MGETLRPQEPNQEYSEENPDEILLKPGDAFELDKFEGQHIPEKDGQLSGSPLHVEWRGRTVYFSGRRNKNTIVVEQVKDKGY